MIEFSGYRFRKMLLQRIVFPAGLVTSGLSAQSDSQVTNLLQVWERRDRNGDGVLQREETEGPLRDNFEAVDRNGDGRLDRGELEALAVKLIHDRPGRVRMSRDVMTDRVELIEDIAYREGNERWKLDLAKPEGEVGVLRPGLVIVHGGGWRAGDKAQGIWRELPLEFARKGYVCISVNYRLTGPGVSFPAYIEDVKCAVRWLRAHAEEHGVDPERIGAYGNSAGAHLVSLLGLTVPDDGLEGDGPHGDYSSGVQAVVAAATPSDFSNWGDRSFSTGRGFVTGPEETLAAQLVRASPVTYARADAPPFLLFHGTADDTVPYRQGERLAEALRAAGAKDVELMTFEGAGHGVFAQHRNETTAAMEAFFERVLGKN